MCKQFCKNKQDIPIIAIFDRDEPNIMKNIHDDSQGFKDWENGVYSFALPIPKHRENKEICIEHYYRDSEIQTIDNDKRRLFLSDEFHPKSGKHLWFYRTYCVKIIKIFGLNSVRSLDRNHTRIDLC
ncbi:RNA-directed DNA polymerase (Reverse transcriptase) [Crocosphaera watsonii WH 0402]|uniref:RNA-directed DNA polymerase (Reverse transcriptase) n=2 Tax=Crocosphaera TaxID=263510 RepID=T2JRD8_CROWT|nr:RNA-directed DNA polymerase (Reverse transcriptase) [Crocosphaera watsonii WH 0402]